MDSWRSIKDNDATIPSITTLEFVDCVNWELITIVRDGARIHFSTMYICQFGSPTVHRVFHPSDNRRLVVGRRVNWSKLYTDNRWKPRHASSLFNYDGSLWVVAGFNSNKAWRYSEPSTRYFSAATGLLSDLTTWTIGADGTGENPRSFDLDNQVFVVANRDSVVLSDEFRIQGKHSKIIIGTDTDSVTLFLEETSILDALVDVRLLPLWLLVLPQLPLLTSCIQGARSFMPWAMTPLCLQVLLITICLLPTRSLIPFRAGWLFMGHWMWGRLPSMPVLGVW